MGHYFVLLFLWITLMNLSLQEELTEQEMKQIKGQFCGSHLSDTLSLVCHGIYNTKQKRNMYRNQLNAQPLHLEPVDYADEQTLSFPYRSKQLARSIIPFQFRKRNGGVASECCHKACSLWEMSSYCGSH